MKRCFKCGQEKPLVDFYTHSMMADGHLNKCKPCTRMDASANRAAKRDHYISYDQARAVLPHRVQARKAYASTPAGKRARARALRADYLRDPLKNMARQLLRRAVLSGRVKRESCARCDRTDTHGHHTDYAKPLEVVWLCPRHHAQEHGRALEPVVAREP